MSITIKYQDDDTEYKYNSFDKIKNYDNVVYIDYGLNKLTVLPKLPNSLETLICDSNPLIKNLRYINIFIY